MNFNKKKFDIKKFWNENLAEFWEQRKLFLGSLRVRIILVVVLTSWIPLMIFGELVVNHMERQLVQSKLQEIQYQSEIICREMARSAYLNHTEDSELNTELNGQIMMLADSNAGRIQIINHDLRVVLDTYGSNRGKYDISTPVLSAFNQTSGWDKYKIYTDGDHYAEFVQVIYNQSLEKVRGVMIITISTKDIQDTVNQIHDLYQIVVLVLGIIVCCIAYVASYFMMRPFKRLEQAMSQANQGNLDNIEVSGCKEVVRIAEVYNTSLTRLKHLDESRQEFVSNVSHELKTPITSIRILADSLISMGEAPVELYQEFMQDISHEIDRESRIIDDLLEMVRLDRSNASLNISKVNLNELLESVLKRLKGQADQNNIVITLECMRQVVAEIDELKMSRVITNVVENGIKYNKDDGFVNVSLNADQTYFYIKIVDTGVGIPEDEIDKIFERFYRVDKARSRETGGSGLGLTICNNIVQMHHGVIRVSSDYGQGTTFVIRIPLIYIPD